MTLSHPLLITAVATAVMTAVVADTPQTIPPPDVDPPVSAQQELPLLTGQTAPGEPPADLLDLRPEATEPGAGAAASKVEHPADVLDLSNWSLTLPTGNPGDPDDITPPKLPTYSSEFFRLTNQRDGVVFMATVGGTTTKNSKYPRSELREMRGEEKAAWANTSGRHELSVREAILAAPPVKPEVVTAQIHDGSDDVMQIRLEGRRLLLQYDDGNSEIVLDPAYELGTVYDVKIVAAEGRIDVFHNGQKKAELPKSGASWYFKVGAYVQSNPEKGDKVGAPGTVALYALNVTHSA